MRRTCLVVPSPSTRAHVVAVGQRREPLRVGVDHRDLVLVVQRVDDRAADVARTQHDDPHERERRRSMRDDAHDARRQPAPGFRAVGVDVSGALNLVGSLIKYLEPGVPVPGRDRARLRRAGVAVPRRRASRPPASASGWRRVTDGKERIGAREGYLVVSLIWLLVAVFGALPYLLAEPQLAQPVDALFESMSGFSTTGRERPRPTSRACRAR